MPGQDYAANLTARTTSVEPITLATLSHDVGVAEILDPAGSIIIGEPVAPHVRLFSHSDRAETVQVQIQVFQGGPLVYADSDIAVLLPEASVNLILARVWTPTALGPYNIVAYTSLRLDPDRSNDTARGCFSVIQPVERDVGILDVIEPFGAVDSFSSVAPKVRVGNFGQVSESFWTYAQITSLAYEQRILYRDSALIRNLVPYRSVDITLPPWPGPRSLGEYTITCSASVKLDKQPSNDVFRATFSVLHHAEPLGWSERAPLPRGPRGKLIKDGGALVSMIESEGAAVYALKGNNTCEFYRYDRMDNVWTTCEPIPAAGSSGQTRRPKKGASLTSVGGRIYAVKGNNTREFWEYDPLGPDSTKWRQLPDVPGPALKGGSGLA
ncbi:MAG: hypothetical protein ABIK62_01300, partial [candidate division WOR-3 bacterium]